MVENTRPSSSLQARRPAILFKKTSSNMFSHEFCEVLQKSIFAEHFTDHNLPYCKYWLIF